MDTFFCFLKDLWTLIIFTAAAHIECYSSSYIKMLKVNLEKKLLVVRNDKCITGLEEN